MPAPDTQIVARYDQPSDEHRRFVALLLKHRMNWQVALRESGWKGNDPYQKLWKLRRHPAIVQLLHEARAGMEADAIEVWNGITATSRASMDDCLDDEGRVSIEKMRATGAIHEVSEITEEIVYERQVGEGEDAKIETKYKRKVKLYSALEAKALLAKMHGLLIERFSHMKDRDEVLSRLGAEIKRVTGHDVIDLVPVVKPAELEPGTPEPGTKSQ